MGQATMLNKAPIFLNCLSRGGSNIFWNLFLTHPDACSPIRETLQIFRADWRAPTLAGLRVALLSLQPRLFDQWYLRPRRPIPRSVSRYIDRCLYRNKLLTLTDPEMRYKTSREIYVAEEVERSRLVCKNNNGLVFLTEILREIYPDACFFGLVRHPVALFESHRRHRISLTPEAFADRYLSITRKMLEDRARCERATLVRFEDVLAAPTQSLRSLYACAGLDPDKVTQVRFKSKTHFRQDGSRGADFQVGRHHWFDFAEVDRFLEPGINELQAERLAARERRAVLESTAPVLEELGYDSEAPG